MRFAAIADVHGNYLALEAVLADIRAQGIADIVNLGDMASGPLDARRTMDALMALDAVHVLGNHDRYLIDRPPEKMGSWDRPAHAQLDERHLDWLRAVPPTRVYRESVFLCHATPAHDEVYWLETVMPDGTVRMSSLEGIEKARSFKPHVVLCDIGLPGMDGFAVARAFRSDPELRKATMVALSGYVSPEDLAHSKEAGFDGHVAKPPSMEKLAEALREPRRGTRAEKPGIGADESA